MPLGPVIHYYTYDKMTRKDNVKKEVRKCGLREEEVQDRGKRGRMTYMNGNSNSSQEGINAV